MVQKDESILVSLSFHYNLTQATVFQVNHSWSSNDLRDRYMQARTAEARRKGKTKQATFENDFQAYGTSALTSLTAFSSAIEVSGFKPPLKVCEHNRAAHTSLHFAIEMKNKYIIFCKAQTAAYKGTKSRSLATPAI